jgi:hypothetical protein
MAFQRINSFLFQLVEPPAPLPFPVAFHNPTAVAESISLGAVSPFLLELVQDTLGGAEDRCVDPINYSLSFRALCLRMRLRAISFGNYRTIRRRESTGPSGEGRKEPLLLIDSACVSSSGVSRVAGLSHGRIWAHSCTVRACPEPLFGVLCI